jgi:hypothetical protein
MTEDHKTWFVALLFLIMNASYANQTQDTSKPTAIEQQKNETSAKEDKSVDNSKKESESEEDDESEDETEEDEEDTENTDAISQNKAVEQNNVVAKPTIMPKPVEKIIVCGIELGRTTINELEGKHKPTAILYSPKKYNIPAINWKIYLFDPNDFGTKEFPLGSLHVTCNEAGIIHGIRIKIPGRMFDDVKQKYINKQFELIKEEQKDGINTIAYKSTDKTVILEKSEKNFFVGYYDDVFKKAIDSTSSTQNTAINSEESKKTENADKPNKKKETTKYESDGIDDLKPLGIVIGATTEKELKSKYKIEYEFTEYGYPKILGYEFEKEKLKMLSLDASDFDAKKAPQNAIVIIDKKGVVTAIFLDYPKDHFKNMSKRLSKKYSVIGKGKNYIKCKAKKYIVFSLVNNDKTLLEYRSNEWNKFNDKYLSRAQNPDPYGIELGKTTENEIRFKYQVVNEFMTNKNGIPQGSWKDPYFHLFRLSDNPQIFGAPNLKILLLEPDAFSNENLPVKRVSVAFDERKKASVVSVVYPREIVDYLRKSLSKKYQVSNDKSWKFLDRYILYKAPNTTIGLFFEPKIKHQDISFLKWLIADTESLSSYDCAAVNYCLDDLLNKYKRWIKENDQKVQNLL